MATGRKLKKERIHRLAIRNLTATDEVVRAMVEEEIGRVKIKRWYIEETTHFTGPVIGGPHDSPQRNTNVVVKYVE